MGKIDDFILQNKPVFHHMLDGFLSEYNGNTIENVEDWLSKNKLYFKPDDETILNKLDLIYFEKSCEIKIGKNKLVYSFESS